MRRSSGHGEGYRYPHDHPNAWVDQQYLPDELVDARYYQPGDQGAEARLVARWQRAAGRGPSAGPAGGRQWSLMDALDLLTVLCGVLALGAAVALSLACSRLLRAAQSLETAAAAFDRGRGAGGRGAARRCRRTRAARSTGSTRWSRWPASIGDRVDTATEATYRALTSPVIKGVALASGTRRAAQRLRGPRAGGGRDDGSTTMRRLFWLGVGAIAGASGTVWAERKVRSRLEQLGPTTWW